MRGRRLLRLVEEAGPDLRFGARLLSRSKGFTAATVATLALGIGANTAIVGLVDGVLLRPLPYQDPSNLVRGVVREPARDREERHFPCGLF